MNTTTTTIRPLWLNPYWEWLLTCFGRGFYRNPGDFWMIARDPQYINPFPHLSQRVFWKENDAILLPAIPEDEKLFNQFLEWLCERRREENLNPHAQSWQRVIFLIETATCKDSRAFYEVFTQEFPDTSWDFTIDLKAWLASFLPQGLPHFQIQKQRCTIYFPDGTFFVPHHDGTRNATWWEKNFSVLLQNKLPRDSCYFHGKSLAQDTLFLLYVLTKQGWREAV